MFKRTLLLLTSSLFLITACNNDKIEDRKMIVIAQHYPSYLVCNIVLELAIDQTVFENTLVEEKEGNVTCADYGRDEHKNTLKQSCYVKDYGGDTNDTCVIGVDYSDYVDGAADLVAHIAEDNATKN